MSQPKIRTWSESPNTYYEGGNLCINIPVILIPVFKQMISRALNTYSDAHPALKEFGDMLEHGRVLQDYYSQRSDRPLKGTQKP